MADIHPPSLAIGSKFGPGHEVLAELGRGSSARVYKGRDLSTGELVAIKVIGPFGGEGDEQAEQRSERFARELSLCARLSHPHIVPLRDSGRTSDGIPYAIFDFVPGQTLADVIATRGALEVPEALRLMMQVLGALASAHASQVIHRDLKPENIVISDDQRAMVLDFGLGLALEERHRPERARLTQRGEFLGTPAYTAPEQIQGLDPTTLSDLYAWGLIFIECLTGRQVMSGGSLPEIFHRQLGPDPVPIPRALEGHPLGGLLEIVTQKDAAMRSLRADALLPLLEEIARGPLPSRAALDQPLWSEGEADAEARAEAPSREPLWLVVQRRNPNFVGRGEILARLEAALGDRSAHAVVALQGLGGVGKSQIALEYAYRSAARYHAVVWLSADAAGSLAEDFADLADALGLPEGDVPDQRVRTNAVRRWFQRTDGWLLVFDSAPSADAIRPFLPAVDHGHVLVTTRNQAWRGLAGSIEVDVFEHREAVRFLAERLAESDLDAASTLADELGRLPLALEEAAAYMESTGRRSASYLRLFRARRRELFELSSPASDYPANLRSTWEISFRELESEEPRAAAFLDRCAFLAAEHVPLALLRVRGDPALEDELVFDRCLAALGRYSLAKREEDAISVHRLVQRVIRDRMSDSERDRNAAEALRAVEALFPDGRLSGDLLPAAGRLLPHALAALDGAEALPGCADVAARLLERTGAYLSARGLQTDASHHLGRAQRLIESAPEPDPGALAGVLASHGQVLHSIGELESARRRLEQATGLAAAGGPGLRAQATRSHVVMAWIEHGLGNWEAARRHAEGALEAIAKRSRQGGLGEAEALSILARILFCSGRIHEARRRAVRGLELIDASSRAPDPFIAAALSALAVVFCELGDLDTSATCIDRALKIGERASGPEHPLVSALLSHRGRLGAAAGHFDAARDDLEHALGAGERSCMALHEDIALCRPELARILRLRGELPAARRTAERALAGLSRVAGDATRLEGAAIGELGHIDLALGHAAAARAQGERAHQLLASRYGPRHPAATPPRFLIAAALAKLGNLDAAEGECRHALIDLERVGLTGHPYVGRGFETLGDIALLREERETARTLLAEALRVATQAHGETSPRTRDLRGRVAALTG